MKLEVDRLSKDLERFATPTQKKYLKSALKTKSATKTAAVFGVNPRTVQRSLSALCRAAVEQGEVSALPSTGRMLFLDIETAPSRAHIWRMFDMVTNSDMVENEIYMLSWAAKWSDELGVMASALCDYPGYRPGSEDDSRLVADLALLLDEADFVVAHNGDRFDIKKINTRMLINGMQPVSPYRSIDTMKIAKRAFGFTSNRLSWLARQLLDDDKISTGGYELWERVMNGESEAWEEMIEYNKKDVILLERVYNKLRPWDHLHPNVTLATSNQDPACTVCGSSNVAPSGKVVTVGQKGVFVGYKCGDCGHNMRGSVNIATRDKVQSTLVNAK